MTIIKTAYSIIISEIEDGYMIDTFEETLIFVGRLIERLSNDDNLCGKYIDVIEYLDENNDGNYIKHLFIGSYLIKK